MLTPIRTIPNLSKHQHTVSLLNGSCSVVKKISIKEIPLYHSPFTKVHVIDKDHIFDRIIQKHGLHQQMKSFQKQNIFVDSSLRVSYFRMNIMKKDFSALEFFLR